MAIVVAYKRTIDGMVYNMMHKDESKLDPDDLIYEGAIPSPEEGEKLHSGPYLVKIKKEKIKKAVERAIDDRCKEHGFNSLSHTSALTKSKNPTRKEKADKLVAWADDVSDFIDNEFERMDKGTSLFVDVDEVLAAIPKLKIKDK